MQEVIKLLFLPGFLLASVMSVSAGETLKLTKPDERGSLENRSEKIRGDSGKWRDEARLQLSLPPPPGSESSLDDWADSLDLKDFAMTSRQDAWLIYRTEQLDDNDRVWVDSIVRSNDGQEITITFVQATWLGSYSKNFTWYSVMGVNLGTLKPGDYTITWIEKPLEFTEFDDPKDRRNSRSTAEKPAAGKEPVSTTIKFTIPAD